MTILTKRCDIAAAINFKKYPTVAIDVANVDDYGIVGAKVCIDNGKFRDGTPYYVDATLRAFKDTNKLVFQAYGVGLSDSFNYYDMVNMLSYANAPIIKPNQDILVCLYDSVKRLAFYPVILRTGSHVSPHCQTPLKLEECDINMFLA